MSYQDFAHGTLGIDFTAPSSQKWKITQTKPTSAKVANTNYIILPYNWQVICFFSFFVTLEYFIHHSLPEYERRWLQNTTFWWHPDFSEVNSKNPTGFIRATNCSFVLSSCFYSRSQLPKCWSWSHFHSWIIRIYCNLNQWSQNGANERTEAICCEFPDTEKELKKGEIFLAAFNS